MTKSITRREAIERIGNLGVGAAFAGKFSGLLGEQQGDIIVGGRAVEIAITSISATTARITLLPVAIGNDSAVPKVGALTNDDFNTLGRRITRQQQKERLARIVAGNLVVRYTDNPPAIHIESSRGAPIQKLALSATTNEVAFLLGKGPLLGLGEGGPQFDRKGFADPMRNGQGAFQLATHGTRAPVQWLVGTDGWALFFHQPYGAFDFTGAEGKFTPGQVAAPLDVFVVSSTDPTVIMREYAAITGLPEMPARWTLGYMQSSRTLDGEYEIMRVARTFREKKLPCDALIYLGTEFAPSGWNTRNGEFKWHPNNFPDPKGMLDKLHADHFKVIVHVVVEGRRLNGVVGDACTADPLPPGRTADDQWPPNRQAACYWPVHKELMDVGVDGWWPDQGDGFDGPSRLNRHRMYWEGPQLYRSNERPFALHRNASAGAQRYGGFIWSGDVQGRWETLATHVAVGINTGLSGFPYWGTDIGGFNPTAEYTGELHTRWFQFGAFCTSFRAHGRNWHLKLPWGWDGGDGGPFEAGQFRVSAADLQNKDVEPICRKYLELRYKLLPYSYSVMREAHDSGLPMMRALWLHHSDDAVAVARGDEYLWGRDILVAPVVERGAASRKVYLPRGRWIDFWNETVMDGGRETERPVDLATMPLFVRAGAVLAMGPVKQHADEESNVPTTLNIYPGADGTSILYDDDGKSFNHKRGEFMKVQMQWRDAQRRLVLSLVPGSRMLAPGNRFFDVRLMGSNTLQRVDFRGRVVTVQF